MPLCPRLTCRVGFLFIVLAHWNKCEGRHVMPLHYSAWANQLILLSAACLAEKQKYQLYSLWQDPTGLELRSTTFKASTLNITPLMQFAYLYIMSMEKVNVWISPDNAIHCMNFIPGGKWIIISIDCLIYCCFTSKYSSNSSIYYVRTSLLVPSQYLDFHQQLWSLVYTGFIDKYSILHWDFIQFGLSDSGLSRFLFTNWGSDGSMS